MARSGRRRPRRSNAFIGLVGALLVVVIMYFGFTKDVPFTSGFRLKAQFQSANSIRPNSPVRIAGVEVGKVKAVEPVEGSDDASIGSAMDNAGGGSHTVIESDLPGLAGPTYKGVKSLKDVP